MSHFTFQPAPKPVQDVLFYQGDREVHLADFKGKVVLLNFWATWCVPCVAELPSLDRLQGAFGQTPFLVVAVAEDREGDKVVMPFFAKNQIKNLQRYRDLGGKMAQSLGIFGMPISVLIDAEGREIGRLAGPAKWDSADGQSLIRQVLTAAK